MRLDACVSCFERCVGRQHLGHVGFCAAILTCFVEPRGFLHHQFGRAHVCVGFRDWKLNALILTDGPAEHGALFGVTARLVDEPFSVADTFPCDENAFGIHAGENVAKAFAFFANQIFRRHLEIVKKHFGRGMIHHGADGTNGQAAAFLCLAHVDDEDRQSIGPLRGLFLRRRARQKNHQVGVFRAAGPYFLAVDDVAAIAVFLREGLQ